MKDTSPDIEKLYRQKIMALPGEKRLLMGFSMYGSARVIVESSLRNSRKVISPGEFKAQLFLRFYESDFSVSNRAKIVERLRTE